MRTLASICPLSPNRVLTHRSKKLVSHVVGGRTPREFAERNVMEYCAASFDQIGLMPANLTTLPHFSVSSTMNLAKSAGEPANTATPRSVRLFLILGSARAALISLLSVSTIAMGVPLGATMPYQPLAS